MTEQERFEKFMGENRIWNREFAWKVWQAAIESKAEVVKKPKPSDMDDPCLECKYLNDKEHDCSECGEENELWEPVAEPKQTAIDRLRFDNSYDLPDIIGAILELADRLDASDAVWNKYNGGRG